MTLFKKILLKINSFKRKKSLYNYSLDERINIEINKNGYVIIPFLTKDEISYLLESYHSNKNDLGVGFHATMHSKDINYRRKVNQIIGSVFNSKMENLLCDYKQLNSNFTVKEPGMSSFFDFHLDWNMVDETKYRSITIWCPLIDTNPENGNLWVLEKSHTLGDSYRCGPGLYLYFKNPNEAKNKKFKKVALQMKAGEAVIYDHKLFHGSPPNLTDKSRIAINQSMIPRDSKSTHYLVKNDEITAYEVDDDFYNRIIIGESTEEGIVQSKFKASSSAIMQEDVNKMIR